MYDVFGELKVPLEYGIPRLTVPAALSANSEFEGRSAVGPTRSQKPIHALLPLQGAPFLPHLGRTTI